MNGKKQLRRGISFMKTVVALCALTLALAAPQVLAQSQNKVTEPYNPKVVDGVKIYRPETVNNRAMTTLKNQVIEVRGIISHYQGIKQRYRFTTDDEASLLVIGDFPKMGGHTYWLQARVVEDGGKLALSEIRKWTPTSSTPPPPIDPLLIAGAVLILGALGIAGASVMRNKKRQIEQQVSNNINNPPVVPSFPQTVVAPPVNKPAPKSTEASRGTIKITEGPNAPGVFPLFDKETRIGRSSEGNVAIVLDKDSAVSSHHASIYVNADGSMTFEDKSSNGSIVDGQFVQRKQHVIASGSIIKLGATTLAVELFIPTAVAVVPPSIPAPGPGIDGSQARNAPTVSLESPLSGASASAAAATTVGYGAELEVVNGPEAGKRFPLTKAKTTLGRENRDLLLSDSSVSRNHATIMARDGKFLIVDDGSAHGTRVNGEVIGSEHDIRNGDRIGLGNNVEIIFHSIR